ncbi:hypothetical protein TNCV_42681 [Trichonephila clavipes]|nr:hypothetical protein TNCV_42681 [Trichonephila clavipes]
MPAMIRYLDHWAIAAIPVPIRSAVRGGASSSVVHVTSPWFKITWSVAKRPRLAEQCNVNTHSLTPSFHPFIVQIQTCLDFTGDCGQMMPWRPDIVCGPSRKLFHQLFLDVRPKQCSP